jgi:hypothetical protein
MSDEFDRGYIARLYLMYKRGEVLRDCAPAERSAVSNQLIDGLCDPDRHVRAKWLARTLHEIMHSLEQRELT